MDNSGKIILDLCGGTGSWSAWYRSNGYTVYIVTLPDYDLLDYKVEWGKLWIFKTDNSGSTGIPVKDIYGVLAAPPCTQFSLARNDKKARAPRDFKKGLVVVDACLMIIRVCQLSGGLKFWALENPKGYLRQFLGKPYFEFKHTEFGHPIKKPTDIWGFFNEPKKLKSPAKSLDWSMKSRFTSKDNILPNCTDEYFRKVRGERRIIRRSITPTGFAEAFFKANR